MKTIIPAVLVVLMALVSIPVYAGDNTGTASAGFLNINPSARFAALGNAGAGFDQGYTALHNNPAILAGMSRGEAQFSHFEWFQDINYDHLGLVYPLAAQGKQGVVGASITYVNLGEVQRTTVSNQTGAGLGKFDNSDFAFSLGYGREMVPRLSFGGNFKYISEELANYGAKTVALDAGVFYRPAGIQNLTVGAVIRNLGPGLKYQSESEKLPLVCELGVGYRITPLFGSDGALNLTADLGIPNDDRVYASLGMELCVHRMIALRAGYDSSNDAGRGYSLGAGFNLDQFGIDYAYTPYDILGNAHQFTFSYSFQP